MRWWIWNVSLVCVGLTPATVAAQSSSAAIVGTVRDSAGRPIAGAQIRIEDAQTGAVRQSVSGTAGQYEFVGLLPASQLTLQATFDGFRTVRRALQPLTSGERRLLDVHLEPAGLTETITVTADAPLGRTSSPELGGNLGREQIDRVPVNGRDLIALAYLIPGAAPARGFYNRAPRLTINLMARRRS